MIQAKEDKETALADAAIALKAAVNILQKWTVPTETGMALLRISRGLYFKAKKATSMDFVNLDSDQLNRASMILNMYSALRIVFENSKNVNGFMNMKNNNPYFNGKSPIESMESGEYPAIYETYRRIDALRGAQW